jgi:hypothetical protein
MNSFSRGAAPDEEAETYERRLKRLHDAEELRVPDRVPLRLMFGFWGARQAGMTCQQAMYDAQALSAATKAAILKYRPDEAMGSHALTSIGSALDILEFGGLVWPGGGLPPDVPYQYLDKEYMQPEEYDEYLEDPSGFMLRKYIPRLCGAASGFALLPDLTNAIHFQFLSLPMLLARPDVLQSLGRLIEAGRRLRETMDESAAFHEEMRRLGFPAPRGCFTTAPYDRVSDFLRGSKGAMLDMFRRRDKLLAMLDKLTTSITRCAINDARATGARYAMMPMHWGLDGFMSPKQFGTYYSPRDHRRYPGRQGDLLVRGHRHVPRQAGARRHHLPAGQRADVAAVHRHAGGHRRLLPAVDRGGRPGRRVHSRARHRCAGKRASRERRRHGGRRAQVQPLPLGASAPWLRTPRRIRPAGCVPGSDDRRTADRSARPPADRRSPPPPA